MMTGALASISLPFAAAPPWVSQWLTTLWIIGVGVGVGLVFLLAIWGVMNFTSPRLAHLVQAMVREGPLWPVFWVAVIWSAFALFGWLAVLRPADMLISAMRIGAVGEKQWTYEIPAPGEYADESGGFSFPIDISFDGKEIRFALFESDQHVLISLEPEASAGQMNVFDVPADRPREWTRAGELTSTFPEKEVTKLYVQNLGEGPAKLTITTRTEIAYPQMKAIPVAALMLITVFALFFLQQWLLPKASAVAHAAYKSIIAIPLYWVLLILGFVLMMILAVLPYNTFGEDIVVYKNTAMTLIFVLCTMQAIWASSESISEELEGRTALTVLSKPMSRRDFVLGKFLGIAWTVGVMFIVLGAWLMVWTAYKPIYDAREVSRDDVTWQLCHLETVTLVPGLMLGFMQAMVLAAISVAISTRLPLVANFVITGIVYLLGNLTTLIVQSSKVQFAPVHFVGQLIATVFPVLNHFNIRTAIATGQVVPLDYMCWAFLYCLLYGAIAMLLALVLFEDRDLA